jgi:hypothetical protein
MGLLGGGPRHVTIINNRVGHSQSSLAEQSDEPQTYFDQTTGLADCRPAAGICPWPSVTADRHALNRLRRHGRRFANP